MRCDFHKITKCKTNVKVNFCNCFWLQHFEILEHFRKSLNQTFFFFSKLNITFIEPNHISFPSCQSVPCTSFESPFVRQAPRAESICWANSHYEKTPLKTGILFSVKKARLLLGGVLSASLFLLSMWVAHNFWEKEWNQVWTKETNQSFYSQWEYSFLSLKFSSG